MEYKTLIGGEKIPSIGLGTWLFGGATEADYSHDKEAVASLQKALELGYTLLDTAEMYGDGHCEELIAQAISSTDRKKLFIVSKVLAKNLRYDDVLIAAKRSLKRLKTPYIDLYLIHAPNPEVPISETMRAMDELVDNGLVRYIGVSNFSLESLKEAQKHSKHPIVAHQLEYSLKTRNNGKYGNITNMESEIIPYCQQQGIIIMAERPIERGLLTTTDHPVLAQLSEKYGKTPSQIAINWLINKPGIIAIPKAASEVHQQENLDALGWRLTDEDAALLDKTTF